MKLQPGTVLRQSYRVESVVARGRYSTIYRSFDLSRPRVVALKEMKVKRDADKTRLVAQFRAEFAALSSLDHPNLPRVWDYFEEGGSHYFVMDFVQATPLPAVLESWGGPPPLPVLLNWLSQILDVLEYLHTRQPPVIFRDLRPANIMAAGDGYLKLVDFGIAKIMLSPEERTRFRDVGAAEYAPPEHFSQGPSNPQTDLYSLGATLYFLASNVPPPLAPDRVQQAPLPSLRKLDAAVPPALEAAVTRMLALQPERRPACVAEVRSSLASLLAGVSRTPLMVPVEATIRAEMEARGQSSAEP